MSSELQEKVDNFKRLAYKNAGIEVENWQPQLGFKANVTILDKLYYYYQSLYFQCPERFLWVGLARLTGGQVLYGMNNLVKITKDPCVLTQEIMWVAKDIFDNLAWQHEMYLADKNLLFEVCKMLDKTHNHTHSYYHCWQLMEKGTLSIFDSNKRILENEQHNTIQHHYNFIKTDAYSKRFFGFTRFVMRNIHPHHSRFIFDVPFGDVTVFKYRWQWITHPKGMWPTWVALPQKERDRLVGLSNEDVTKHNW
jgi:hypothetical protein